jgi:hypothetical protein
LSRAAGSGIGFVDSFHITRHVVLLGASALAMMAADALDGRAFAQGKLDARYTVSLGGLPVGRGAWVVDITDDHFSAAASGATTGLVRVFASGQGQSAARGTVTSAGQLVPSTYVSSIATDQKYDDVRMVISGGTVKEFVADPPTVQTPDRVPLTDAHRRGVADPMTASLVRVPGNGDPVAPQACQRTSSVFDGRMRYDLRFAFKRVEPVHAEKGYAGPAVVCAVYFHPIAGHIPDRAAIKYLAELRDMELWLAPIAGTRVMVPYRVTVPTPLGVGVLQATQFVAVPQPGKASAKTQ